MKALSIVVKIVKKVGLVAIYRINIPNYKNNAEI